MFRRLLMHLLCLLPFCIVAIQIRGDEMTLEAHENGGVEWPEAQIPFELDGNFSTTFHDAFTSAVNEIHERTCVRFHERTQFDRFFLRIYNGDGCWSYVGMMKELALMGQPLSLGLECQTKGVILHEFYRRVRHKTDDAGPYNLESILHYEQRAFAIDPSIPTIIPRSTASTKMPMGQRERLSSMDIQKINRLYNCTNVESTIVEVTKAIETGIPLNAGNSLITEKPIRSMKKLRPKSYYWFKSADDFQKRTGKSAPSWLKFATFADAAQEFPRSVQCATNEESNCQDRSTDCLEWALRGECERKPGYMLRICRRSCCNCNDSKCFDTNDDGKFRTLCLGRFRNPTTNLQVTACDHELTRRNALDFCPQTCNECFNKSIK
ncbi:Metalloendopeptidase [Aphelenchoides besseyi]|nr:Metalloendopeptidase [Aphelenchoides besseyi]KAI6207614.1 Metalloendopeptidase [Aphelenchoides besseyi]